MNNIELRLNDFSLEQNESDEFVVSGYVNEVNKFSHLLGSRKKFKERIKPGAFERALGKGNDIHFLAEHDSNKILASTRNNSLTLVEDEKGLYMSAKISETSFGKDYYTLIKDGILRNMSFGFSVVKDKWKKLNDGTFTRDVEDLILYEVSVVTNPAYPQSAIAARGLHLVEDVEIREEDIEMEEKEKDIQKETPIIEEKLNENKEKEDRAYISYIYDDKDMMNCALEILADTSALIQYEKSHPGKLDSDSITSLQQCVQACTKILTQFNEVETSEAKDDNAVRSVEEDVKKEIEEVKEEEVKEEEVKEEDDKIEETKEENRNLDFSSYYNKLKELDKEYL